MTINFGAKSAKLVNPTSFITLAFRNGLMYRSADGRINSAMIPLYRVEI